MKHRCPVCGFDSMPFPPKDNNICSCCGTEFGYHDLKLSHADLRKEWINKGTPWFSTRMPQPPGWNPTDQMNQLLLTGTEMPNAPQFSISPRPTALYSFRSSRKKKRVTTAPSSRPSDPWSALLPHSHVSRVG